MKKHNPLPQNYKIICLTAVLALTHPVQGQSPVPIYYGLNVSHGRSWTQMASDGSVGAVYFKRDTPNGGHGTLIYHHIAPNGTASQEIIKEGAHLEVSVLLFDADNKPHIFVAESSDECQRITELSKNSQGNWNEQSVIETDPQGGRHIYELSAATGPDGTFHLLMLKTRSNPDSDDYYYAFLNAHLSHFCNAGGQWQSSLIHHYDMPYTLDEYVKASIRQDMAIDKNGHVHVVFGEQIKGLSNFSPVRLLYATNQTGSWCIETALSYRSGSRDSAGWYPAIGLDENDQPHLTCAYIQRVSTGSASRAWLLYKKRVAPFQWTEEIVATRDDGYYGTDGRDYTGGLPHLRFDAENQPHIAFTDIASSHANHNYLNLGNIRHAQKINDVWEIETCYQQPLPIDYTHATEMVGLCLLISGASNQIRIIGQEMIITDDNRYTCSMIDCPTSTTSNVPWRSTDTANQHSDILQQNSPNPFNPVTEIGYHLPALSPVRLTVFNLRGEAIAHLVNEQQSSGPHIVHWNGNDLQNRPVASGIYLYQLQTPTGAYTKKMILLR